MTSDLLLPEHDENEEVEEFSEKIFAPKQGENRKDINMVAKGREMGLGTLENDKTEMVVRNLTLKLVPTRTLNLTLYLTLTQNLFSLITFTGWEAARSTGCHTSSIGSQYRHQSHDQGETIREKRPETAPRFALENAVII